MGLSLNIGKRRRPLTFKWLLYFDLCSMLQANFGNLWQHLDVRSNFCFQHILSRKFGNFVPCDGKYLGFTSLDAMDSSNMEWILDLMACGFVTNMSSIAFIELKTVMEFIQDLLNKDISRGLMDADRIKVWLEPSLYTCALAKWSSINP